VASLYVPHPFDPMRRNLAEAALDALVAERLVDAIETTEREDIARTASTAERAASAERFDLAPGRAATPMCPMRSAPPTVEMPDFDGPADFLAKLREGRVVGHHWDEPRPCVGAIVPSTSGG
jgi:hypothetical protein